MQKGVWIANDWQTLLLRDQSSFANDQSIYVPVTFLDWNIFIRWEKLLSQCQTNFTEALAQLVKMLEQENLLRNGITGLVFDEHALLSQYLERNES